MNIITILYWIIIIMSIIIDSMNVFLVYIALFCFLNQFVQIIIMIWINKPSIPFQILYQSYHQ